MTARIIHWKFVSIHTSTHEFHVLTSCSVPDKRRVSGQKPTATATWPYTDENDNRLRYSYKLKYYTLCDPPEKLHDPLPKKLTWTLHHVPDYIVYFARNMHLSWLPQKNSQSNLKFFQRIIDVCHRLLENHGI